MKSHRDTLLSLGLFALLVIVTAIAAAQQAGNDDGLPPLSSQSYQPDGARALREWMQALGYSTREEKDLRAGLSDSTGVLLVLEPIVSFTASEWNVPRILLTTRVASASPSTSSAIMTRFFFPVWAIFSKSGRMSLIAVIFLSVMRMCGSSYTASMREGSVII